MHYRITVAWLSAALAIAPISSAVSDWGPHCLGHNAAEQITSAEQSAVPHEGHHADCSWAKNGRNDLVAQATIGVEQSLPRHSESPALIDTGHTSSFPAAFAGRAPPLS